MTQRRRTALVAKVQSPLTKRVGTLLIVVAIGYLFYAQVSSKVDANQASEDLGASRERIDTQQEQVIDPLDAVCARDAEVRRRLGDLCDKAKEVAQAPERGEKGDAGRGITGTAIVDGHLRVSYTDGVTEDKGAVVGAQGVAGRGVVGSTITTAGHLVLSYSDGTTEDAGTVVGPQGAAGENGENGRSVVSVTVSPDFHLTVAYDDGTTADAGQLPPGPRGEAGRGIASVAFDMDTCRAVVTYTDGTSEQAPMTGCEPNDPPPDPDPLLPLPGG